MKLNVIVTAHNVGDYITQCVESIQSQITKFEFRILIRDDGSTDNTRNELLKISQKYPNIFLILDDNTLGEYESIQQLITISNCEYIAILNGRDYYTDLQNLQRQVEFLEFNQTFVMTSSGFKIETEGELFPIEDLFILPETTSISKSDLLEKNYKLFGIVFRNIKRLVPFPDYFFSIHNIIRALTYRILDFGNAKCLHYQGGVRRNSKNMVNENLMNLEKKINMDKETLILDYKNEKKVVTIIDCYVHNKNIEELLRKKVNQLKSIGKTVFLVTNSKVVDDIAHNVDYYFYNKENHLFENKFEDVTPVVFWSDYEWFKVYRIEKGYQRHALSVLRNMMDVLNICKQLGFTHFERLEVDSEYNQISLDFLNFVPKLCESEGKIGLFYKNEYESEDTNVSFHYFYSKIEEFISLMPKIRTTDDYVLWLEQNYNTKNFKNAEIFIYESIKKFGLQNFLVRNGSVEMNKDFGFIEWNTVTSISNLSQKYQGATTKLLPFYEMNNNNEIRKNTNVIFSENKVDELKERRILYYKNDVFMGEIRHTLKHEGHWIYNEVPSDIDKIDVIENEILLYSESIENENGKMVLT